MWWILVIFILLIVLWCVLHETAHAAGAWLDGRKIIKFRPYPSYKEITFFGRTKKFLFPPYVVASAPPKEIDVGLFSIGPLLLDLLIIPPLWVLSFFTDNHLVWWAMIIIMALGLAGSVWAAIAANFFRHFSDISQSPKSCLYFSYGLIVFYAILISLAFFFAPK